MILFVLVVAASAAAIWAPAWAVLPAIAAPFLYAIKQHGPTDPPPLPHHTRQHINQRLDEQQERR